MNEDLMEGLLKKDEYEENDINKLTKHDLEHILKHHGITARGTKDELQERILNISLNDDEALTDTAASTPHKKKRERKEPELISDELLNKIKYTNDDINELHVDQLKQILKKHSLHVTGKKVELIDRILTSIPNTDHDHEHFSKALLKKKKYDMSDIKHLKSTDLELILRYHDLSATGKKEELMDRIITSIPQDAEARAAAKSQRISDEILNKDKYSFDDIKDLKAHDLQFILINHDLSIHGKKSDLISRVLAIAQEDDEDVDDDDDDDDATEDMNVENEKFPGIELKSNVTKDEDDDLLSKEKYDERYLKTQTLKTLQAILTSRGLKTSGLKDELITRIIEQIPMPEYEPPGKGISYEDDLSHCITFSLKQAEKSGGYCKRCQEEIDQGRVKVIMEGKGKKNIPFHIECFFKYKPNSIQSKTFDSIIWEDCEDEHLELAKALFTKYSEK